MKLRRVFLLVLLFVSLIQPTMDANAQSGPEARAALLLNQLSAEERIGQLFLVTFKGTDTSEMSQIYDLITRHHIGGVVLLSANDNFAPVQGNILTDTQQLIANLQNAEATSSQQPFVEPASGLLTINNYIPLFVAINQEGGGYPYDQMLSGLTPLPNQMAVGATWDADLAQQVGAVMGDELSWLGFNLYFGLSLDVLSSPNPLRNADLSTRVFGGDPFWVSQMGAAYIRGVHSGGDGRVAVIARHFPGRGESDRAPEQEVSTVRKSLEQLKQIELAPFFAVTGDARDPLSVTDGLLVSHIRYQGLQGNIRATTRPVSFDPQALTQILSLQQFVDWRKQNGLIVSDDLGSVSVRRFYDPGNNQFQAQSVARDAFLAGNDLLYMGNIISSDAPDEYTSILRTLEFFTQKYLEDTAFAQRVNESALRVLTLKFKLYDRFTTSNVLARFETLDSVGVSENVTFNIAQRSATLVSPSINELDSVLPDPPSPTERILFIGDTSSQKQCSQCPDKNIFLAGDLRNAVLRLYGFPAGGRINGNSLATNTFTDILSVLDSAGSDNNALASIRRANWIIIATAHNDPQQNIILNRLLSEKQDLLRNKRIILFSFGAPYYLDATNISRLTAYYCLYSQQSQFVDVAARLLFREINPVGSLPVSVPGIGYDLISATSPDPNQVIGLSLDLSSVSAPQTSTTPAPTAEPLFGVNDTISVTTNVIVDHNQHTVPDGTIVQFTLSIEGEGILREVESPTQGGLAKASFRLDKPGLVAISAASEPAKTSIVLQVNVSDQGSSVVFITPTPLESPTTLAVELTPEPTPQARFGLDEVGRPLFGGWLVSMLMIAALTILAYLLAQNYFSGRAAIRFALLVVLGGLAGYNYHSFSLAGSDELIALYDFSAILQTILLGVILGVFAGWVWERVLTSERSNEGKNK